MSCGYQFEKRVTIDTKPISVFCPKCKSIAIIDEDLSDNMPVGAIVSFSSISVDRREE
jgi:hypothetical protein